MIIENLQFFDNNGYNLNFDWNKKNNYWEGTIHLPKVSVGLYANTTIYVLEEVDNSSFGNTDDSDVDVLNEIDYSIFDNSFIFPIATNEGDVITFKWDSVNKFVDEFFMFNFDESYTLKEASALIYTPNDGPDCNTLIVNRFDEYSIPLDFTYLSKALPIHIAFMASEKYDATTYTRTLFMYYNKKIIAKIKFYAETVEEDERLKIWNDNLGYKITPEDTMIFYKSDIKEYRPDYILLNEKRKELMLEGSNIYPYIGSYKAIINAIKFFGYENLNIIEYWRNVNPNDENFGKIYHSSKYSLTHKETLTIGARKIILPNKDYKKINALALVYSINKPTGEIEKYDDIPKVKEKFTYSIEEALIKLFALRKKLNKEFMPGTSRIIDIIGEANYFGLHSITKVHDSIEEYESHKDFDVDFDIYPGKYGHITDNTYFGRYINLKDPSKLNYSQTTPFKNQMLSDIYDTTVNEIPGYNSTDVLTTTMLNELLHMSNNDKCDFYKEYYREAYVDHTVYKSIEFNDDYPYENEEYDYPDIDMDYTDAETRFSAKFILTNKSFKDITFGDCELMFKTYEGDMSDLNTIKFNNIDDYGRPDRITWIVRMSEECNQYDDDLKYVGITKKYDYHSDFELRIEAKDLYDYDQYFIELPYIGYYDVILELGYDDGNEGMISDSIHRRTKLKCIKVEPYNIELKGFYYDARELPKHMQYEESAQMIEFIQKSITNMHGWATAERTSNELPSDASMPYYSQLAYGRNNDLNSDPDDDYTLHSSQRLVNPGPYFNKNVRDEWYLADNLTYEIGDLKPFVKYTRYIRNGVDVKPYTWFLLGFEYSKIVGKINPHWYITNNSTSESIDFEGKKYLTLLLKKEGNYTVTLQLEDKLGNKYEVSRNIIVVNKAANYNIYQTFKKDYDYKSEQDLIRELNEFYAYEIEDGDNS